MWNPLTSPSQLQLNSRLRTIVHEGNFQHGTEFNLTAIGQHFFFLKTCRYNGQNILEQYQSVTGYRLENLIHYCFEIYEG